MSSYRHIDSPLGTMLLRAEGTCLTGVFFAGQKYYPANVANVANVAAGSGEAAPQEAAVLERRPPEVVAAK